MWRFAVAVISVLGLSIAGLAVAPPAFDLETHGLFGLSAQHYRKSWMFKAGVAGYALITIGNLAYDFFAWRAPRPLIVILLAGALAFGLTVFFEPPPMLSRVPTDRTSAQRHQRLLYAGIGLYAAGMIYTLFLHSIGLDIFFNLVMLSLVSLSVWLARREEKTKGLYETLAFVTCMLWLIVLYPAYA